MRRCLLVLAGLSAASLVQATLMYQVEATPGSSVLIVSIDIPEPGPSVHLEMPRWAPGSYRYADYSRNVVGVKAFADGKEVPVSRAGEHGWSVSAGGAKRLRVSYGVRSQVGQTTHHFSGPATYMYVKERIGEDVFLKLNVPAGWKSTCGLDSAGAEHTFVADDYDVLADNPVSLGDYVSDFYVSNGVRHEIVYHRGPVELVDRAQVIAACRNVSDTQARFWGGLPFQKYVWHFVVNPATGGAGGLEHLSSTQITLAAGMAYSTVSVLSHEYFHAWNVKRIRSNVLGPFDYQALPKTGALWWLEGVTDYYADLLLYRGRYGARGDMMDSIVSNVRSVRANAQRMAISPYDSSYRVSEAANGRGNSQGFGVNYYSTGWVVGLCLDAELRHLTDGRKSLDNICWDLWETNKDNQPGFGEGEIRRLLVKHGGASMGPVYDKWVREPGELPVEDQLKKIGLEMKTVKEAFPQVGALWAPARSGLAVVRQAAAGSLLQNGDQVLKVGDIDLAGARLNQVEAAYAKAEALLLTGRPVRFTVLRREAEVSFDVTATRAERDVTKVVPWVGASAKAKRLATQYLSQY